MVRATPQPLLSPQRSGKDGDGALVNWSTACATCTGTRPLGHTSWFEHILIYLETLQLVRIGLSIHDHPHAYGIATQLTRHRHTSPQENQTNPPNTMLHHARLFRWRCPGGFPEVRSRSARTRASSSDASDQHTERERTDKAIHSRRRFIGKPRSVYAT